MMNATTQLFHLYQWLVGGILLGWILGRILPAVVPLYLGRFLYWVFVPLGIIAFLRQADLSASLWLAPTAAWFAILLGAGLAWVWLKGQTYFQRKILGQNVDANLESSTQGSFILASMVGNTGYMGFPIVLALVGPKFFGWAVFYDGLGTVLGAYGLGVALAARFGTGNHNPWQLVRITFTNPALLSMIVGLTVREMPLPDVLETGLREIAWGSVAATLVLMGMRLSQLSTWRYFSYASVSLAIKMLIVPLVIGSGLVLFGVKGSPLLVLVLQMATPPAFATLVLAEAFNLDRELAVTALAMGAVVLLMTLPLWLFLFGSY